MAEQEKYGKYVMPILFAAVIVLTIFVIKPFIIALLSSAVIAYTVYPLYRFIIKTLKNKTVAAFLVCFIVLLVVTIPVIIVMNTLSKESYLLYIQGKQLIFDRDTLRECSLGICTFAQNFLGDSQVRLFLQKALETAATYIITNASELVVTIPRRALELFVMLFAVFYLVRDGDRITSMLERLLITKEGKKQHIIQRFNEVMYAVIFGALSVALIQGILGGIGFALFGISSPITWGVTMFFLALIPYGGTALIWVPASAFIIIDGITSNSNSTLAKGIGLFLYSLLFVGCIDNILKPKIIGSRSRVHPLLVLLGILGGLALMGLAGIVVGPVLLAMAVTFTELYISGTSSIIKDKSPVS